MSFPSNYAHRGLFIHKSSISEANLIIPSNVLNSTHCSTNMGGGEILTQYFCRRAAEVRCSMSHTHIKCATTSLAWFPWGEKLYSMPRLHLKQLRHFYRLCPLWDRRTRAVASPGSQSNTQLEQHKWVLGLGEFNFMIRYPDLAQSSKHTVSIDSLSSSPSIQKSSKKIARMKKKRFHPGWYCRSSPCSPPYGRTHQNGLS